MVAMTERDRVTNLRARIAAAITGGADARAQRERAWRQFAGLPNGAEAAGNQSQVQSMDVNSMVTAVCAQMAVSFSTDSVASFTANSEEDEQKAQAESSAVNKIIVEDNGGFKTLLGGVQSALLYRSGYVKVYWKTNRHRQIVRMSGVKAGDLPVMAESEPGIERRVIAFNPAKGTASIEVTKVSKLLTVRPVVADRFFYDLDWDEADISNCPLAGEVYYKTRDDLVREGVDPAVVRALKATQRNTGQEASARSQQPDQQGQPAVSSSMDVVRIYDAYVRMTMDDGDYAFLYHVRIADEGEAVFLEEPELASMMPYASGSAFPIVGKHDGEALAEKLRFIQDGKTEMLRQWYANVRSCSYGRFGVVVGQADADDIMNPVGGGAVRLKRPDAIVPIPVIDVGASIKMALMQYDQMRTEMGGAAVDFLAAEAQVAQDTAHGTERVYASKEVLVSYMTRNLAESLIRGVYLIAHAQLRTGEGGPISVKVADSWQQVNPADWQERTHAKVNVGYSMGERMQISGALFSAIALAKEALANGLEGQLVTKQGLYRMVLDWLTMQQVQNGDSYFVDPTSPQAQQAAQQAQEARDKQAMEAARQQAEILGMPERIKAEHDKFKQEQELEFKYFNAVLEASINGDRAETGMVVDLANIRANADAARLSDTRQSGSDGGEDEGRGDERGGGKQSAKRGSGAKSNRAAKGN